MTYQRNRRRRRGRCKGKLYHMLHFFGGAVCECRTAMSHHSDEQALLSVTSDSFWEPGNYKRTTRRVDDGHRLCSELQALVQERADIEKTYAKSLRGWAKKWNDLIEKGPEYGTMEAAWKGGMVEAERLSDLHLSVRDRLVNDVIAQIKNWQKDTYHKSMIQLKERKEMDEAFKKAQKPWAKLLQKVERTRLEYHTACKQERTAQNQERNASGDSSLSPDQVKKMAERVSKCREEVAKNREKYQAALAEITAYNPRYIEDMTGVFERCQQMEAQRLTFFKDVLFSFHKCLNISQEPQLPQIYEEFHHTINNADHQKDLKWWANNHGINMAMAWPQFEEYTEEFRDIAKGKSKESLPTGPITLLNQRPVSEDELPPITNNKSSGKAANHTDAPAPTTVVNNTNNSTANNTIDKKTISAPIAVTINHLEIYNCVPSNYRPCPSYLRMTLRPESSRSCYTITDMTEFALENGTASAPKSNKSSPAKESAKGAENPFEEDEWDEESAGALTDTGEPGVPVRALYDYTGAESDELSFRQGDLFEKLEDEDEQGWCKGRKDGRVGLYPANYVEPVGH
ncbi:protein kinase C and casein kinase substrate in neurons protein 1 isoform X3 [Plodia interpunctella]|uniref:protein kinase C and casein kinase substrate in neurons protein 1 isoform X3 n=1 Tax=Plodia interpunctella TaxID=58824 RepID=UPI00236834D4|nr:protein kinase C and casein kinase substrate in neurons protein 1 isoform X3 [Plodia interpunctella]